MNANKLIFTIALTGFLIPTAVTHAMEADDKITAAQAQEQARQELARDKATTLLSEAITKDDVKLAERAIKEGADVNGWCIIDWDRCRPLSIAVAKGNAVIVLKLLDAGARVNEPDTLGCTRLVPPEMSPLGLAPLEIAALYGNEELVKILLNQGADSKESYDQALINVVISSWASIESAMSEIYSYKFKIAPEDDPAYLRIARMLLARGANVNHSFDLGSGSKLSPLQCAFFHQKGNVEMIKLLLFAGAVVDDLNEQPPNSQDGESYVERATPEMRQAVVDVQEEARTAPDRVAITSKYLLNGPLEVSPLVDLLFEFDNALFFAAKKQRESKKNQ
jgi:hypothetical protein